MSIFGMFFLLLFSRFELFLMFNFIVLREYCDAAHFTVNHSLEFVNSITGACTNEIEGLWTLSKLHCPNFRRHRSHFEGESLNVVLDFCFKLLKLVF